MSKDNKDVKANEKEICFVIMPFSDSKEYNQGHFLRVYNYILKPAIEKAGYEPHRIDFETSSNLIQEKIIRQLIEAPMVLCDLSSRNPNVLFELGMRQAFDKPVVLVKDNITERIFDISGLATVDYRSGCIVDEVEADVEKISKAIIETKEDNHFNSLVRLVNINAATLDNENTDKRIAQDDYNAYMLRKIYSMVDSLRYKDVSNNIDNCAASDNTYTLNELRKRMRMLSVKISRERIRLDSNEDANMLALEKCKVEIAELRRILKEECGFDSSIITTQLNRLNKYELDIDSIIEKVQSQ